MIRPLAIGLIATGPLAAPALARRDGMPGNPPSAATRRTLDRATGANTTGTNTTGANPGNGTGTSRAPMRNPPRGNTPTARQALQPGRPYGAPAHRRAPPRRYCAGSSRKTRPWISSVRT